MSRFITAQQTAFRKLIKKHKKWSGSAGLELNFNKEVLSDDRSFTKVDLEPLLLDWEEILDAVRVLYEERMNGSLAKTPKLDRKPDNPRLQTALASLHDVLQSTSQARFDSLFATMPLGDGGKNAVYWVHPENVVELQVLMLQHSRSHAVHRHTTSSSGPSLSRRNSTVADQDTGLLIVDDQERFVRQQSATTLESRENTVGAGLQNATITARWAQDDEAIITTQLGKGHEAVAETAIKRKHLAAALDPSSSIQPQKASVVDKATGSDTSKKIEELRSWCTSHQQYQPLATITSNRQRFTDIASDSSGFLLATLDRSIAMTQSSLGDLASMDTVGPGSDTATFPYAVLRVRQEGSHVNNLLRVLDGSHLVERVRGFSLEYHAVWHCCQPGNTVPPFWISLLKKDIRKLPKTLSRREASLVNSNFASQSTTPNLSATSDSGHGDSTAVEDRDGTRRITIADQLETPPLSSFRKKRTRSYARGPQAQRQKYWSEYDNPSDSDDEGAYVLFIDPNAESSFSQTWRKVQNMFGGKATTDGQPLLQNEHMMDSSDEESQVYRANRTQQSYGTLDGAVVAKPKSSLWLSPVTMTCLGASMAILVVGYILAMTGRKKQVREVDAGIIFAIVSSLLFAMSGVACMFGRGRPTVWAARMMALVVLAFDAIASGALLAWILA